MAKQATTAKRRTISPDSPRKKMKDRRRIQLIEANMTSIAERGLAETTITHVSEAAGMSRGIINFYFDSKETMMRETLAHLMEEQFACWQAALEKAKDAAPREKLETIFTALFSNKICTRKKLAVWAAFVAHAATHAPYRFLIAQNTGKLREEIDALMKDMPGVKAQAADQVMTMIDGLWLAQLLSDSMRERKEMTALCLAACEAAATMPSRAKMAPLPRREEKKPALAVKPQRGKPAIKPRVESEEAPVVADLFAAL